MLWKDIEGYEGKYEVSDEGVVRNKNTLHAIKPAFVKGYYNIGLYKESKLKIFKLHRLVAIAYIGNPLNKREVNHKDEDSSNNKVDNLMWVTPKENSNWGTRKERITETLKIRHKEGCFKEGYKKTALAKKRKVCQINPDTKELINTFDGIKDAAEKYKYSPSNISSCCRGERKKANGYSWMFYEDYLKVC